MLFKATNNRKLWKVMITNVQKRSCKKKDDVQLNITQDEIENKSFFPSISQINLSFLPWKQSSEILFRGLKPRLQAPVSITNYFSHKIDYAISLFCFLVSINKLAVSAHGHRCPYACVKSRYCILPVCSLCYFFNHYLRISKELIMQLLEGEWKGIQKDCSNRMIPICSFPYLSSRCVGGEESIHHYLCLSDAFIVSVCFIQIRFFANPSVRAQAFLSALVRILNHLSL